MYKKIIKVKLSPKLNSTEVVNFVLKNMNIINSNVELKNLNFCIGKKQTNIPLSERPWPMLSTGGNQRLRGMKGQAGCS